MNSTDLERDKLLKNVIKLEVIPSEDDDDANDTDFCIETKNDQLDNDDTTNTRNPLNILKYEELNDTLPNYEQYNIPENLSILKRKQFLRMRGLAYIGGTSKFPKIVEARKLGEPCKSRQCAKIRERHCSEFTEEQRKEIFRKFWYEMNWSEKRLYVKGHVVVTEPCRRRIGSLNSKRRNSIKFYLNMNSQNLQVCKNMFSSTLALGAKFVHELINKPSKPKKDISANTNQTVLKHKIDKSIDLSNIANESSLNELINEHPIPIKMLKHTAKNTNLDKEIMESRSQLPKSTSNVKYSCLSKNERKEIGNRCKTKYCHNNKCLQIENEQRNLIYNLFWFEMNESEKLIYVQKNIEVIRTGPIKPNIMDTYYYFLKISKRRYPVCKKMFLSTLGLDEKNVEIICDDYKKYLMKNSNEPVEEEEEDESDDEVNSKNIKTHDDPLDVNIEYIDVYGNFHMDYENSDLETNTNVAKLNERTTKNKEETKLMLGNDSDMSDCNSVRNSDQSSWQNYSENGDSEFDENDDLDNDCLTEKTFISNKKHEIINLKKRKYTTRSSNRNFSEKILNNSDDEFNKNYNLRKCKITTKKPTQQTKVQLSNGIFIPPEIGPACKSTLCKKIPNRMCSEIIEEQRKHLFKYFWGDMSITERKQYVKENIEKFIELKIQKYKYHLIISNEKFPVCKKMFVNTLCLHEICIHNWLNNIENYDFNLTNATEKKSINANKKCNNRLTENTMEKFQILDEFLDTVPKIPPKTFCTQKSNKIYFNENIIGTRTLYHMYIEQMKNDGIEYPLSKKNVVKRLALKNLRFYKGKKLRQGKIDDDIKISDKEKENIKRGLQEKYRDKALARKSPSTVVININSFKVKLSPNIKYDGNQCDNSNTRLCCYNFIVCNILTSHGMCYWFCETDASNTNNSSFITCLYDYLNNFCKNSQQIIIYCPLSDNRFKNIDMSNALLEYSIKMKKIIIQKFLPNNEKVDTECHTVYNSIERKLKTFEIILPSDYITASIARREPCDAKWMNFRVFKDFSVRSKKHRYYKLESSDGTLIDHFLAILYKDNGDILYKNEFDDEWSTIPENLKGPPPIEKLEWPQLYLERRKISAVKYQSLQSLKAQLPRDCQFFYDYLTIEI